MGDFAPDLDPIIQGFSERRIAPASGSILTDTNWVYSTLGGWKNMPSLVVASDALPSTCVGAYGAEVGSQFIGVFGTVNQLYILSGGMFVSQGLALANTANAWYFTVYGTDLLATNGADPVQVSSSGGPFTALAGSPPVFSIIEATDFSLFGIVPNSIRYWFTFNDTIWTPSIATATGNNFLSATAGNITAAKALRAGIIIYKPNSCYVGQYVGPPLYWGFVKLSDKVGTPGAHSVVTVDTVQYFVGPDDFYQTDGTNVARIPNNLRKWFFDNLDGNYAANIFAVHDQAREQILFWFPTVDADPKGTLNAWVSFSLLTGKWARGVPSQDDVTAHIDLPVEGVVPTTTAKTWAQFENTYVTWGDQPAVVYGSPIFSGSSSIQFSIVDSNHRVNLWSGAFASRTLPAFVQTGDLGDKNNIYAVKRARPGFIKYPTNDDPTIGASSRLSVYGRYVQGQTPTLVKGLIPISPRGYFDVITSDRLQQLKIGWYTDGELSDLDVEVSFEGQQ